MRTLQPLSTSMPSTCAGERVSNSCFVPAKKAKPQCKIHNVIMSLCDPSYKTQLLALLEESISSITESFDSPLLLPETEQIREKIRSASHCTRCVLFFLLLNVDAVLKDKIINLDSAMNLPKMTRFLLDLRQVLTVRFFTDETCTPSNFMEECIDCYMLS